MPSAFNCYFHRSFVGHRSCTYYFAVLRTLNTSTCLLCRHRDHDTSTAIHLFLSRLDPIDNLGMAAPNVHISTHPCLRAKLSQLRSKHANARETKTLIHEIALIVAVEALASELTSVNSGTVSLATLFCIPLIPSIH